MEYLIIDEFFLIKKQQLILIMELIQIISIMIFLHFNLIDHIL